MSKDIYVLIDHDGQKIRNVSWETLAMGQLMAGESGSSLHAVVLGQGVGSLAEELAQKKVETVMLVEDGKLADYDPDVYCGALRQLLSGDMPHLLLLAHTYQNIDMAPKLAAAMKTGLVTDCIGYQQRNGELVFVRQMFRNKLDAVVRIESPHPWLVTVQAGACSADELQSGRASIMERKIDLSPVQIRRRRLETIEGMKGAVDLTKAEIIVGVGRGVKKEENLEILKELAEILGAELGASRPVVDSDWLERERQIGSSGQSVSPRLYIACGISGAIQHIVGMKSSGCIVAINTDPNAPIFNVSHYGIVGDLTEIVPVLTKKLKQALG